MLCYFWNTIGLKESGCQIIQNAIQQHYAPLELTQDRNTHGSCVHFVKQHIIRELLQQQCASQLANICFAHFYVHN